MTKGEEAPRELAAAFGVNFIVILRLGDIIGLARDLSLSSCVDSRKFTSLGGMHTSMTLIIKN